MHTHGGMMHDACLSVEKKTNRMCCSDRPSVCLQSAISLHYRGFDNFFFFCQKKKLRVESLRHHLPSVSNLVVAPREKRSDFSRHHTHSLGFRSFRASDHKRFLHQLKQRRKKGYRRMVNIMKAHAVSIEGWGGWKWWLRTECAWLACIHPAVSMLKEVQIHRFSTVKFEIFLKKF